MVVLKSNFLPHINYTKPYTCELKSEFLEDLVFLNVKLGCLAVLSRVK